MLALNDVMDYPTKVRSLVVVARQYKIPTTLMTIQHVMFIYVIPENKCNQMGLTKQAVLSLTHSMIYLNLKTTIQNGHVLPCEYVKIT